MSDNSSLLQQEMDAHASDQWSTFQAAVEILSNKLDELANGTAVSQYQYSNVPDSFAPQTAGGDILSIAIGQMGFIQNLGTNPLFVKLATTATSSSFSYILKAAASSDDGTGGISTIKDHIGVVSVAGTSPRFIAWHR
jgi:hypothetical protein